MTDREKVINELNDCLENQHIAFMDGVGDIYAVSEETIRNVISLLKEHEAMKPIYSEEKFGDHLPHCPVCKKVLPSIPEYGKSNYCHRCGRAVKWE